MTDEMTDEQWLAIRKEAGFKIDPETAEVMFSFAEVGDPYVFIPNPRNTLAWAANTMLGLREATSGYGLVICPKRPRKPCGRSTVAN